MNQPSLDKERIERLAREMLLLIRANFQAGPTSRARVYEALNALAFCTATLVRGSDPDEALQWFSNALNVSLQDQSE